MGSVLRRIGPLSPEQPPESKLDLLQLGLIGGEGESSGHGFGHDQQSVTIEGSHLPMGRVSRMTV